MIKKSIRYLKWIFLILCCLVFFLIVVVFSPFVLTKTDVRTTSERILSFPVKEYPLEKEARIYWNEYLIPFIEAETDTDASFLLGVVHAHLRLGQMEMFRMVVEGRLAEMGGPLAVPVDYGLRILDVDKSVKEIVKAQDPFTRSWVDAYVDGINWYIDGMEEELPEYRLLNIPKRHWTVEDVYSLARLASADLSWGVYIQNLMDQKKDGWEETWNFFLNKGQNSIPSFTYNAGENTYQIFNYISKSGSNSLVISPQKSITGKALMANDPHLGIFAPNMWFLTGLKSPSFHLTGLQIPGIPFVALGRNMNIAWGGTNMRSISTHLVELTEEEIQSAKSYTEIIKSRYWFPKKIRIRETKYGPVISDAPFLRHLDKPIALQWLGHRNTNELKAFLNANKAQNFNEFRSAFKGYAVSGQNIVYADNEGNIGQIAAYSQPLIKNPDKTLELVKEPGNTIVQEIDSYELPYILNPDEGFIASANNLPFPWKIPIAYEYTGYNRMQRMREVCNSNGKVSIDLLKNLQTDVLSYEAKEVQALIAGKIQNYAQRLSLVNKKYYIDFVNWDGKYTQNSSGAVAFETLMYFFASGILEDYYPGEYMREFFMSDDRWMFLIPEIIEEETAEKTADRFMLAMQQGQEYYQKYPVWGDMHRLLFGSALVRIPGLGKKFKLAELGMGGSSGTLMKTAHEFSPKKHYISYGSNSRHISDLSDPDENYFVLLGGQDGWTKSMNNGDQLKLWMEQEYIRIPLHMDVVKTEFTYHVTRIVPLAKQ